MAGIYMWAAGKVGWLVIIGALLAVVMFDQVRVSNARAGADRARAELADTIARYAQAAKKAEEAARQEEARRADATRKVIEDAHVKVESAQAAAALAGGAAERLQQRVAALIAAGRAPAGNPSAPGRGPSKQSADALDLLSGVLVRMGGDAGQLAAYADRLRIAGLACERAYDSLTVTTAQ